MFTYFKKTPELYLSFQTTFQKDDISETYPSTRQAVIVNYTVLFPTVRVHLRLGVLKMFSLQS